MTRVITYGTYDLLHYGHIRLLERAKALGDYLIVGVTSDNFDKQRGKINVQQSAIERVEAIRATGLADEIIIEEYEGQKIDDIVRHKVDIFTVGSDWAGKFDYINEYCKVVYLERTEGVSSSTIRSGERKLSLGMIGEMGIVQKFEKECRYVNGIHVIGVCVEDVDGVPNELKNLRLLTSSYEEMLKQVDAVYIVSHPTKHFAQAKQALQMGKHVLCEAPISLTLEEFDQLNMIAKENDCVLMDSIKTAYSTAYARMRLLVKGGCIGRIVSVDATCTSLKKIDYEDEYNLANTWSSIITWGPTALLPILQLLGPEYRKKSIVSQLVNQKLRFDTFTKISFLYPAAVATIKVGNGVKSEGELIISGTRGYVYVPAPWWKMDYFEVRYENPQENKRYFYQLEGEGIRYEIIAFLDSIKHRNTGAYIDSRTSREIVRIAEDYMKSVDVEEIL